MPFKIERVGIKDSLIYFAFLLISLTFSVTNFILHQGTHSEINEWILSVAFFVCLFFSYSIRKYAKNYAVLIILVVSTCRYCLSPFSYYITGITGLQYLRNSHNEFSALSISLMIYEMIIVFLITNYASAKYLSVEEQLFSFEPQISRVGNSIYLFVLLGILVLNPQIFTYILNFSFESSGSGVVINSSVSGLYVIAYRASIIVLFCLVIHWLATVKNNFVISLALTIIFIWISAINLTGKISRTLIIVNGISLLLVLAKSFPEKKKYIVTIGLFTVGAIAVLGTMFRFEYNSSSGMSISLNNMINSVMDYGVMCSYFGGVENVNTALAMAQQYKGVVDFSTFWNDISYSFPFFGSRFADFSNITPVYFNMVYHGISGNTSQIIPYIGQGYTYLGTIISPLFSAFVVYFAIRCNRKMKQASNELEYFLYCSGVYYGATFAMYNINIFCMHLTNLMLPIAIAVFLNKKRFVLWKK